MKSVHEMYVHCSLQVRNFDAVGVALSDCCQEHATSVVDMGDGRLMYRCERHRGVRRMERGTSRSTVMVEED